MMIPDYLVAKLVASGIVATFVFIVLFIGYIKMKRVVKAQSELVESLRKVDHHE